MIIYLPQVLENLTRPEDSMSARSCTFGKKEETPVQDAGQHEDVDMEDEGLEIGDELE